MAFFSTELKTRLVYLVVGFILATILFIVLSLSGCFSPSEPQPLSPYPLDSVETPTLVVYGDTVTETVYRDLIKWRAMHDTLYQPTYINDTSYDKTDAFSFDTTYSKKVTVSDNGKDYDFTSTESVSGTVDKLYNRAYVNVSGTNRFVMPYESPLSKGRSLVQLFAFGEFDLFRANGWRIGVCGQINISTITAYIAPNVNPEHILSVPVGVDYLLWEK